MLDCEYRLSRHESCFNVSAHSLECRARIWNSTTHRIEMMNHMLMADVMYLDASAFERTGICLPLVAQ